MMVLRVLAASSLDLSGSCKPMDDLIYSLALGPGLRLAEIVGLDVGDVYIDDRTPRTLLRIRTEIAKGDRKGERGGVHVSDRAQVTGATKRLVIALIAAYASLALGDEPAAQPPAPKKRAVALGYAGSTVGVDVPRDGDDRLDPGGWGVLGRIDLHRGWGLQLGYALKDDQVGSGGELSLAQAGLYAYYAWEGELGDSVWLRFYPKVGVSRTDFEE